MTRTRKLVWGGVLLAIAVSGTVALVQYRTAIRRSEESVLKTNLFRMRDAIDQYRRDKGKWPSTLNELADTGYMRAIPEDPTTRTREWRSVPATGGGVSDVKSAAPGHALDGSRYSDW
jgi:general secretion pathway protein G